VFLGYDDVNSSIREYYKYRSFEWTFKFSHVSKFHDYKSKKCHISKNVFPSCKWAKIYEPQYKCHENKSTVFHFTQV